MQLSYQHGAPLQQGFLKQQPSDFIVREQLGYELSGEGEFVALYVRKTNANTLFVGEKLAQFAGISAKQMSYAGLKDRHAITEQWFCLHLPNQKEPVDFSQFQLEGVEILKVVRHQRKIRVGSLQGNEFELLLRNVVLDTALETRLNQIKQQGFPNYFTEQRFGRDGHNLTQALRWAAGEIRVKDRKKRGFYLSSARSEVFNLVVSARLAQGAFQQVLPDDVLQLAGSHSVFRADPNDAEAWQALDSRLLRGDVQFTAPLMGEESLDAPAPDVEKAIIREHQSLLALMKQERVKSARRAAFCFVPDLTWQAAPEGVRLRFSLPAGSYATALVRELIDVMPNDNAAEYSANAHAELA